MPDSGRQLEQLRLLNDRLPDGIITFDAELLVSYANVAARRLVHPVLLILGQPLPDVWDELPLREFAARMFHPRAVSARGEVLADDGRMLSVTGIPARKSQTAGFLIEDISDRSRRHRAEREFVANAAHELLTPLTGIAGAAHVLEAGAKDDPESRDRFIAHIAHECGRLARISRALLVLARATSGEEPPRPEIVDLRPLLEDAIEGADGDVELVCPDSLTVFADRDLAEQALTNLIVNADRHGAGSPITITARATLSAVAIEISDSGTGILPEQIERVRRRFASGAGRDGGGFGLGVSIAAQALEVIGGSLEFDSRPGEGTHARVELPAGQFAHA